MQSGVSLSESNSARLLVFRTLIYIVLVILSLLAILPVWLVLVNASRSSPEIRAGLSLIPGTSRSGAAILGAILVGTSRYVATEFSFFLAIPTMFGASGLKIVKYFMHGNSFTGIQSAVLLTGVLVSFIVAYLSIKFLLDYIKQNDFKVFGWYRIILGIVVIAYFGLVH